MLVNGPRITVNQYGGIDLGAFRTYFFLVLRDYLDLRTTIWQELSPYLERFARRLPNDTVLVTPYEGDIETVHSNVLAKDWTLDERREILRAPNLLMIDRPLDQFDPRENPWVVIHLGVGGSFQSAVELGEALEQLAEDLARVTCDPMDTAQDFRDDITASDAAKVFEVKPGVFGFSVDLIQGARLLRKMYLRFVRR